MWGRSMQGLPVESKSPNNQITYLEFFMNPGNGEFYGNWGPNIQEPLHK